LILSLSGLSQIIPAGTLARMTSFGRTILTTIVPGLFAQTVAQEGATAAQWKFNAAALANPYVLLVASIAGLVGGLYLLSDALNYSAAEKLADAKAEKELLKSQIETNRNQRNMIQGNLNLVDAFKKQGESAMENNNLLLQLSKAYPGVIDKSKSYEENLLALEKAAKRSKGELSNLKGEFEKLVNGQNEIDFKIAKFEVDKAKQDLEDELTNDTNKWYEFPISFVVDKAFGVSAARDAAEFVLSEYTKKIYKAKDDKELQRAGIDLQMAIFNNPKFANLSDEEKKAMIEKTQKMVELQADVIKKRQKNIDADLANMVSSGYKDDEIVDLLSKKYKKSKEEIQQMIKTQKESKTVTNEQSAAVIDLAAAWNDAKKATSDAVAKQIAEISELTRKGKDRTKEENAMLNEKLKQASEDVKTMKRQEQIEKNVRVRLGLEQVSGKSRWELAKQATDLQNKNLELLFKEDELIWKIFLQEENREETDKEHLVTEQQKLKLLEDQEKTLKNQLLSKELMIESSSGELVFNPKLKIKEEDKQQITEELLNVANAIVDQKGVVAGVRFKIKESDEEILKLQSEFAKKKLEFEIKYELASPEDMLPLLEKDLENVRAKLNDKTKKLSDKEIIELQTQELDALNTLNTKKEEILQLHLNKIKEQYDKNNENIESKNQELLNKLKEQNSIYFTTINAIGDDKLAQELKRIDKSEDAKLKQYENWKELGIISEKQFEKAKTDIANEFGEKRKEAQKQAENQKLAMAELQRGVEIEVQRAADLETLTNKKTSLEQQIALYDAMKDPKTEAQRKEYESLKKNLEDTQTLIETKGKDIGVIATELGNIANQGLLEGIAGDPEATKKALKKSMAFLAGYLEKKVSAFIIDWLLTPGVTGTFSFLPLPLQAPAFALASTAITAVVHKLVGPILTKLTSFASGGRIDKPTPIIAGDALLSGSSRNTEWVMRDADIMATAMVAATYGNANVVNEIRQLRTLLSNQQLYTEINFDTLRIGLRRADYMAMQTKR